MSKELSEEEILKALENGELIEVNEETQKNTDKKNQESKQQKDIIFLKKYTETTKKRTFHDFFLHFQLRYKNIHSLLYSRKELKSLTTVSRLSIKNKDDTVSLIVMIKNISETKNKHKILEVEDSTGSFNVLISKNNKELYKKSQYLVLDEVIGITGKLSDSIIFANSIIFPDIPLIHELKKHPQEIYAAFIGDPHLGSRVFLKQEFDKMISWINGEIGSEKQKQIAKKIKYIFFLGDLVEGVGIYPGQENDLAPEYHDIKNQYDAIINILKKLRKDIKIVIIPGNHDYGRIAEPQLPLTNDYSEQFRNLKNVTLASNPAFINFARTDDFPGFNIVLYHGGSLIYYCDSISPIRNAGGQKAVHLAMKALLQKRHLAPSHKSTLYIPDPHQDFLFIDTVPDFFVTGHIHRANIDQYRNVTLISSSCWTGRTEDQIKRGLESQPAKLPIVNLHTREVKIINFLMKEHEGVMER